MKLHPLEDRIVVRPNVAEATTASGLVIPDTAKEKPQQGEVLATGPGRRAETSGELIPTGVSVGDTSAQKEVEFKVEQQADGKISVSVKPFLF